MRNKEWLLVGLLILAVWTAGCGNNSRIEPAVDPQESAVQETVDVTVDVQQQQEQLKISVTVEQVQLLQDLDFGEGKKSDALKLSLTVDNHNDAGLQLHPDSGRIWLNTGEETMSSKGEFHETYPNGTLRRGDLYFPLQLTRLNEISDMKVILAGPVNQYYHAMGDEYTYEVTVNHPQFQEVTRETILERAYDTAVKLTEGMEVSANHRLGRVEEMGPLTVHLINVLIFEQVEHPFAEFLNLDEPVSLLGVTMAIENRGEGTVYFSNARNRLINDSGDTIPMDHLMSQYMSQEFYPDAVKTGTVFYQIPEDATDVFASMALLLESPWETAGDQRVLLSDDQVIYFDSAR
ncbi:MAG: hypothetical protein SCK57_07525 [Bacillota bacterium]|nr:hypothetical protein [Bacillota bacterium]MDW7677496.1 hypothetical protein [Bacillota bacterium]